MLFRRNSGAIGKLFLFLGFLMLVCSPVQGQNKKKKKKKYKKKSDANILARAYNDVTTRNNYYFNANLIYKDILTDVELQHQRDFDELLPIYFHQNLEDFSSYSEDLQSIIKKTSVSMQLHDNTRWKDNVYLLLGKARYLNGEYYDALHTFHFVVTTMKKDIGKSKGAVDNKAKLKAMKAKEAAKKAKERKKEIDEKKKEIKDKLASLKKDKEKEMAANAKKKNQNIKKKIKAKEKIIALRKKGKPVPEKLLEIAYGKKDETEELVDSEEEENKAVEKEEEEENAGPSVVYKTDYRSDKKIQKDKEREQAALNDTIPMSEKEIERYNDLSFWEKIKHKESRPESLVWLAKSLMKINKMAEAQTTLEYAEALPKLTRKQREGVYAAQSFFYLENRRYENALESLSNAAIYSKKKKKTFYHYLSGQVNELIKEKSNAVESYRAVADGKSDYQLKFHANMRMIHILQEGGPGSDEEVIELMTKLLKNGSNKEYRGLLHYKLAAIYAARGDMDLTVDHLQQSITTSRNNPAQKGLSFRELGEVYILKENYNAATIFYDSAVAVLPMEHMHYDDISFRAEAVAEAAMYAETISTTDSLLLLSTMSDKDLELYIAELEAKQRVESRKRKKKGGVTDFIDAAPIVQTGGNTQSGDWYFYNPNLRAQGYNQFKLIWGDRALEHDWRRASKETVFDITSISDIDKKEEVQKEIIEEEKKIVLNIPNTEEEIAEAHKTLSDAYYELGKVHRNKLEINSEAKQAFESLVNNYPEHEKIDRAYYYLYLIYTDEQDQARAAFYKDLLLNDYPLSQYAYAINNPFQTTAGEERPEPAPVEVLYASTYDMFVEGHYTDVITRRKEAFETYKESPLMPKFDFLEALSYGHLDSLSQLKAKLGTIIAKYPNHEVEPKAREYLAIINRVEIEEGVEDTVVVANDTDTTAFVSIYTNEKSNSIFGMVAVQDKDLDIRQMIQLLDQFNVNSFSALKLRVSNAYLDKDTPLILVKRFREKPDAIDYIGQLEESLNDIFGAEQSAGLKLLLITQDNFRTLFTTKKLDEYQMFFDKAFK